MAIASRSRTGRDRQLMWAIIRTSKQTGESEKVATVKGYNGVGISRQAHAMYSEEWLTENWGKYTWEARSANPDILPLPLDEPGI